MDKYEIMSNTPRTKFVWTRFLHQKDIHFYFKEETLRLSSAKSYRDQVRPIGDWNEGRTKFVIPSLYASNKNQIGMENLKKLQKYTDVVKIEGAQENNLTIVMNNCSQSFYINYHVFCMSEGAPENTYPNLAKQMMDENQTPYDAALIVSDIYQLAAHIMQHGYSACDRNFICNIFDQCFVTPVRYDETESTWDDGPPIPPQPDLKNSYFAPQREWRVVFVSKRELSDTINIHIPGLRHFFTVKEISHLTSSL